MADDITLTVRVRDMSRGELSRVNQQVNRLRQNFRNAGNSANSTSRDFNRLGTDINRLGARFRQMVQNGTMTRRSFQGLNRDLALVSQGLRRARGDGEITRSRFRAMSHDVDLLRSRMTLLGRQGGVFNRLSARILILGDGFRRANEHGGLLRRTMGRIGDETARGMRRAVMAIGAMTGAMRRLTGLISIGKRMATILVATLILLGPIAQALGAVLVAALGGAFIALGALALKNNEIVKSAFADMKNSVAASVRGAAEPMAGDLANGIKSVGLAVQEMRPMLEQAFRATGPLIENFIGAFTDLAKMSMPGIVDALKSMGPAIEGFRTGLGLLGQGIGDMFAAMTANGGAEALKNVWITLGVELRNLLVGIGEFVNFAAKSETATAILIGVFRSFSGVLNLVQAGLSIIDKSLGWMFGSLNQYVTGFDNLVGGVQGFNDALVPAGQNVEVLKSQLAGVEKEIARIKKLREESDIAGPAKDYALEGDKATSKDLETAQARRAALLQAIGVAETQAATATEAHAAAVQSLTEKIRTLNGEQLTRLDAKAAMEQSIDDAIKKAKELTGAVKIQNGEFKMSDTTSRQAYESLSKIASNTAEAAKQAEAAHEPLSAVNAIWAHGRRQLLALAPAYGISRNEMQQFIDKVLQTPESVVTKLRVEKKQADQAVAATKQRLREVDGTTAEADAVVSNFRAMERLSQVEYKLNSLDGKTADTYVNTHLTTYKDVKTLRAAHGGATGGLVSKLAGGGSVQSYPDGGYVRGPGSGTSDSIFATFGSGLAAQISDSEYVVRAQAVRKYGVSFLDRLNSGKLRVAGFARGGKVSKGERQARSEARGDLTISHFGKMAGFKTDEFKHDLGGFADSLRDIVGSLNHWRSVIMKATHGGLEKSLLHQLDKAGKSLIKYQRAHDKVEKSLDKAKSKLDDLRQSAASMRDSVKSGVLSATNITNVANDDKHVTMADVMSKMRNNTDKATAFASALSDLKKRGVDKRLIEQIASAGIEGGGIETAGAILSGSDSEIKSLNEMQKQINKSAKKAGKTASDAMYASGIKAAEGMVHGLKKKKKDIEKAMMNIAKAMEKAIKKALGIHSPSRVMQQVGHYTAEGFAVGVQKNKRVDTAWTSMLTTPSSATGGHRTSGGSSNGVYVIQLNIGNKPLDEIVLDSNRRTVRTRGGNVQAVFGNRTR